jgi:hypothetical protein
LHQYHRNQDGEHEERHRSPFTQLQIGECKEVGERSEEMGGIHGTTTGEHKDDVKFGKGKGFRVGANLFRARFDNFFLSAKGFYQFLKEQKEINNPNYVNSTQSEYTLVLNHWGVAVDIGIPLFSLVDFKIVEGGVTFYNISFTDKTIVSGKVTNEKKYESDKTNISYYVGSGLIIHIIPDYISIEGTAFYNFLNIDKINYQNKTAVLPNGLVKENLISKGGFSAALQLNVGFPL